MAKGYSGNRKAFNAVIKLAAELLKAESDQQIAMQEAQSPPPDEEEDAIDCEALGALIESAQGLYLKHCPIL